MKSLIYSPYFESEGGGEKYLFDIAIFLQRKGRVVFAADWGIKNTALSKFNLDLSGCGFEKDTALRGKGFLKRAGYLLRFDNFFYTTDGSLPPPLSGKNFMIIQSPKHIPGLGLKNRLFLKRWKILVYSSFIKKIVREKIGKNAIKLSPCVEIPDTPKEADKKNIILSVGRFFRGLHDKKGHFLLDAFLADERLRSSGWKLVIAGGLTEESGREIYGRLKDKAKGMNVEILANLSYLKLKELYKSAKIYWHAAGFQEDLEKYPERAEHFGITSVESMSYGVPVLGFNAGGQAEIIKDGINGYKWETENELIRLTLRLIKDESARRKISGTAWMSSKKYSRANFEEKLERIIYG